jgi:hypothetical protein
MIMKLKDIKGVRQDMKDAVELAAAMLGIVSEEGRRLDANETYAIARAFQAVESKVYDLKYPTLAGRDVVPPSLETIGPMADSVSYFVWTETGMADFYDAMSDELPSVDVYAKEVVSPIRPIGTSYRYTDEDVLKAARMVRALPVAKATAARRAIEQKIDYILAYGDADRGIPGALNNANVTDLSASITGGWANLTPTQILADFQVLINGVASQSKEIHQVNRVVLPTGVFGLLNSKPRSDSSDMTILAWLRANFPGISIMSWNKLNGIGAGATDRIMVGEFTSENIDRIISQEFQQLPPQAVNMAFNVPCKAKIGGARIRYPLAFVYADGV